jgi:NitT/TauT family transport system substrate-binding protein
MTARATCRRRRRNGARCLVVALTVAVGLVAGCGGGGGGGASTAGPAKVTVQDVAGVPSTFLSFGVQKGLFRKQGLDLKVVPAQGGAAIIPAVLSGKVQFGGSNLVSVLLATSKGLPIQVVAPGTSAPDTTSKDFVGIVVRGDSRIRTPKQLEAKTIAINTLNNVNDVTDKAALEKQGVDVSKLKFTEVDLPDMEAALAARRVDAITPIEPFLTSALQAGNRLIARPYVQTKPGLEVGSYLASKQYISEHPDVVRRFAAGVRETGAYVAQHPGELRNVLATKGKVPAKLARKMALPVWHAQVDMASLQLYATLMKRFGLVKEQPSVKDVLANPSG